MAADIGITQNKNLETNPQQNATQREMILQILVVVAFVSTVVINALANILPINGMDTGELSDKYQIYITPAGYVFSIWSLIYLGLLAFSIYQALPSQRFNPRLQSIRVPFILSSIFNMAWIYVWHYELVPVSLVVMLLILSSLVLIYTRLHASYSAVSAWERWTTHIPFRIYLGWITVATIVNTTVLLDYTGTDVLLTSGAVSAELWTAIILGVATVIGLFFTQVKLDVAYGLVFVWAFAGIAVKHSGVPTVSSAAIITASIMGVAAIVGWIRRRNSLKAANT